MKFSLCTEGDACKNEKKKKDTSAIGKQPIL